MRKFFLFFLVVIIVKSISGQNDPPVAVDDELVGGICGDTIYLDVLENDYHPDGKGISIKSIRSAGLGTYTSHDIVDGMIMYTHPYFPINLEMDSLYYTIMETDFPESYSEEAKVIIHMEINPEIPEAKGDKANVFAGLESTIDVLANDELKGYEPTMMGIDLDKYLGFANTFDMDVKYAPFMASEGMTKGYYFFSDMESFGAVGDIEINITGNKSYDSLTINNINAGIHSDGFLFCKYNEILNGWTSPSDYMPHFEYPKGSGKHTIFSHALWIGGLDDTDSLHLAAQRYKQIGYDYQFGPISDDYSGEDHFVKWSRLWNVSKEEISYHRNNYWKDDYTPVEAIINWPGNGDVDNGQVAMLAPFFDKNENSIYEPMDGDYPLIRGDQTIFYIFNDDRVHTETQGGRLKVEIHGMAYAYNNPLDTVLDNTIFVHLDLYNRSNNTYHDTYLGYFTDIDLGYPWDDYVGSHVEWGSFYGYNGLEIDGNGEAGAYGDKPPAQSITVLAGPFMDGDNEDNPSGQCDFSLNGLNFGDGVIDNERMGLSRFIHYGKGLGPNGDPQYAPEYYSYLLGLWRDGTPILYGANGYHYDAVGPACRFMFPGDSDTCNWGTDGVLPNDGYNQNGRYWTESEVGNLPSDRRGLGVSGPFTFKPGDVQELELAFNIGQGDDYEGSVEQLFENLEELFTRVRKGEIIVPNEILEVPEMPANSKSLDIYPNPSKDFITVRLPSELFAAKVNYQLFNSMGLEVLSGSFYSTSEVSIQTGQLERGIYILVISHNGVKYHGRMIKM